jgi:DNA-binding NarL/FixJ family response regulator
MLILSDSIIAHCRHRILLWQILVVRDSKLNRVSEREGNLMPGRAIDTVEVGVVESEDQGRQFMTAVIGGTPGYHVTFSCGTGRDALWSFTQRCPELFIVSLFLRDMSGTELIQRARSLWPSASPILLIPENQPRLLVQALEAGACAYLPKPCVAEELVRTLWTVHAGGAVVSSLVAKAIVNYFRARGSVMHCLTERESQVLTCLSRGLSQQAIAGELHIDKATVRTHVRNILSKLDARSSAEAVAKYLNPNLAEPAPEAAPSTTVRPLIPCPANRFQYPLASFRG